MNTEYENGQSSARSFQSTKQHLNVHMKKLTNIVMGPNSFIFEGSSKLLQSRLGSLTEAQCQKITDATIIMAGEEIKQLNLCLLILTGCLIITYPLMCTNCWKKCVYPAYIIQSSVYNSLSKLLLSPHLNTLTITLADNAFDHEKARILYDLLVRSQVKGFTLTNAAAAYDYQNDQYDQFQENVRPIKEINHIVSEMIWLGNCRGK